VSTDLVHATSIAAEIAQATDAAVQGLSDVDRAALRGLTGRQKAAIFLISLGSQRAADILKHLTEREVEAISAEMTNMWRVKAEVTRAVVADLAEQFRSREAFALGGPEFAREVLEHLLGPERAEEIVGALIAQAELRPFDFLRRTPPEQVVTFLSDEPPQTKALVVASLNTTLGARVLAEMPPDVQAEVAMRIARMGDTNPGVIEDVERGLRQKLANVMTQEFSSPGGIDSLAELLNRAGRSTERIVLQAVQEASQELADEIRQRLFTFDDIVVLADRDIQLVLREVDQKDLGLALRGAAPEIRDLVFRNMSSRGADMLRDDLETAQPQRRAVVEEAQGRVVAAVRRLEDAGAITIAGGGDDPEDEVI
jgi:flagellar motor switch protein FliG